jgi:hypothetical protein
MGVGTAFPIVVHDAASTMMCMVLNMEKAPTGLVRVEHH